MLGPNPFDSAPSGRTASSGFLQEPTASRPVRKLGTSGFSRLTSVSRMRTSLSLTAFPSSTAVSPGWTPSLAAPAAGIRSLFLKPSSKLSTSGKAVGRKVRLRLVPSILSAFSSPEVCSAAIPCCWRSTASSLRTHPARADRDARLHPPFLRWRSGIADADSQSGIAPCSTPLTAMSGLDAPCRRFLASATARSRPDLPRLRLACSRPGQTVCHVLRRVIQTATAAEPMLLPMWLAYTIIPHGLSFWHRNRHIFIFRAFRQKL